jgi:hypothetical protein
MLSQNKQDKLLEGNLEKHSKTQIGSSVLYTQKKLLPDLRIHQAATRLSKHLCPIQPVVVHREEDWQACQGAQHG